MGTALDGITVLDMSVGMAGALATMFLCDNGARVIRLEVQNGDARRQQPGYMVWDRGKESLTLDPNHVMVQKEAPAHSPRAARSNGLGRVFRNLIQTADVLVESFSPSSKYQEIFGQNQLVTINPRLVHCSITAYGKNGPLKDDPPIDELVMARAGILATMPGFRKGPVHVAAPIPSAGAAILTAESIVAALFAREKTGFGRKVETTLLGGALLFASY